MNPTLEIFSQGEEIVTGQTVDTNAAWLSQQAVQLGFTVTRHTAVGDKLEDLVQLLKDIVQRADCCICTGGLGPTSDDLTAEAVAQAFHRTLELDDIAFAQIQRFFENRNKPMPDSNRKQAMLPRGSERINNDWGTAPGFALQQGHCWFVFLPGVPMEMRSMFMETIQPAMCKRFTLMPSQLITLRVIGMGESDIQDQIKSVSIPDQVQLGFRADSNEVQVKLLFPPDYPEQERVSLTSGIAGKLGRFVFGIDRRDKLSGDLVSVVDHLMKDRLQTLAVIESASQGLLAAKCIGFSWLLEASYQQSTPKLAEKFNVQWDAEDLMATAKALAVELQKNSEATIILVQLFHGSFQRFHDKSKTITLTTVLLQGEHFEHATQSVSGPLQRKQNQAALLALDLLRRFLQPPLLL